MSYLLLAIATFVLVSFYLWLQRKDRKTFSKYAEVTVRVLVDPNNADFNKAYGCVIFQVPGYTENLKEIVFTDIRSTSSNMYFSHFGKLNFFIVPGNVKESAMRSVGFSIWKNDLAKASQKKDSIIVKGYFKFLDGKRSSFIFSSAYGMEGLENYETKVNLKKEKAFAV